MKDIHPSIKIEQAKSGDWYFNIVAANGLTLATSEMYKRKSGALNGARSVINNLYDPIIQDNAPNLPSRSNIGIRLSTMKRMGIETMIDVAAALNDGRLVVDD